MASLAMVVVVEAIEVVILGRATAPVVVYFVAEVVEVVEVVVVGGNGSAPHPRPRSREDPAPCASFRTRRRCRLL